MLAVVNAAYSLTGDTADWLQRVAGAFVATIDGAYAGAGHGFDACSDGLRLETACVWGEAGATVGAERILPIWFGFACGARFLLGRELQLELEHASALAGIEHLHEADDEVSLLVAKGADSRGWLFAAAAPRARRQPSTSVRLRWQTVAAHVARAGQMRSALGRLPASPATAGASSLTARLRAAVAASTPTVGSSSDTDRSEAGRAWLSLAAGTWSLVDHFEAGGRVFMVALPGAAAPLDPQALTRREREVAEQVARGRSGKEIAYELGLRAPTVSQVLHGAMRKLRLDSVAHLAALVRNLERRP